MHVKIWFVLMLFMSTSVWSRIPCLVFLYEFSPYKHPSMKTIGEFKRLSVFLEKLNGNEMERNEILSELVTLGLRATERGGKPGSNEAAYVQFVETLKRIPFTTEDPQVVQLLTQKINELRSHYRKFPAENPTFISSRAKIFLRQIEEVRADVKDRANTFGLIERHESPPFRPTDKVPEELPGVIYIGESKVPGKIAVKDLVKEKEKGLQRASLFGKNDPEQEHLSKTETVYDPKNIFTLSFHGARGNWGIKVPVKGAKNGIDDLLVTNEQLVELLSYYDAVKSPEVKAIFLNACHSAVDGSKRESTAKTVAAKTGKLVIGFRGELHTVKGAEGETYTYVSRSKEVEGREEVEILSLANAMTITYPDGKSKPIDRPDLFLSGTRFVGADSSPELLDRVKEFESRAK